MKKYSSDGTDFDQVFAEPTGTLMMILIWQWHKNNQYQINKVPKEPSEVQYYLFHLMKSKLGFKKSTSERWCFGDFPPWQHQSPCVKGQESCK